MYVFEYEIPSKSRFYKPVFAIREKKKGVYEIGWRFGKRFEKILEDPCTSKHQAYYASVKYLTQLEADMKVVFSEIKKQLIVKGMVE